MLFRSPYMYSDAKINFRGVTPAEAALPVDLATAREYFNVVTDKLSDTLTGPADAEGKATVAYADIIRASAEEMAECDYAIVYADSPNNVCVGLTSGGYDRATESFIPISLQYGEYVADCENVRLESISGPMVEEEISNVYGVQNIMVQMNCSYYEKTANLYNETHLDSFNYAVENMPEDAKIIMAIDTKNPMVVSEFEENADAILMGFAMDPRTIMDIVTGQYEPSGLLPFQMPKDMSTVEGQFEDVPRDLECYVDSMGNTYDFAYGMNWSGEIEDERTAKYDVAPLVTPENTVD